MELQWEPQASRLWAVCDECVAGSKPVYWADDANDGGHAIRRGTVSC
ncbi:hypothetical protein GCM10023235_77650 [Kitasatospora terrestris]|uniref:Uncharacterized protein n=1 Tax=Kitasatospora terrestris TaxID=258051 RepID=A0ABP9ERX8_9ACTN